MAYTPITQTLNPPLITDSPSTFDTKAFQYVLDQQTLADQINTVAGETDTNADNANTSATNSSASADLSEDWATSTTAVSGGLKGSRGYAQDAETAANASSASANFKGAWSSLTGDLNKPSSVEHNGTVWVLLNDLADVTTSEPGVSGDWIYAYYPSISGQAGNVLKVSAGDAGVEWGSGLLTEYQEFTASGTFTKDPDAKWIYVEVVAAGGGGANDTLADSSGGGGGGAGISRLFRASDFSASETVTIGSGGAGGASGSSSDGSDGGDSSIGSLIAAPGGNGNTHLAYGAYIFPKGFGGGGISVPILLSSSNSAIGAGGHSCGSGGIGNSGNGGNSVIGGAGGGGTDDNTFEGSGGSSVYGGDGGSASTASSTKAGNGTSPGGGGGGSSNDGGGGDGADGRVRIWQW